jgi:hypothetical protein
VLKKSERLRSRGKGGMLNKLRRHGRHERLVKHAFVRLRRHGELRRHGRHGVLRKLALSFVVLMDTCIYCVIHERSDFCICDCKCQMCRQLIYIK